MSNDVDAMRQHTSSDHATERSPKLPTRHDDDDAKEKHSRMRPPFRYPRRVARHYSDSESESSDVSVFVRVKTPKMYSHKQLVLDTAKDRTVCIFPSTPKST